MTNVKYTLRELKNFAPKAGETFGEKVNRFFSYIDAKKETEENLDILKDLIEERVIEKFIEDNYKSDIVDLQKMFEDGEITEEELIEEISRLKEEAKYEMEGVYQDPETKIMAGYKTRNTFKWLDGMNVILKENGKLTTTKRITSDLAKVMNLADFEKESALKYGKIYENYGKNKEEKEALKKIKEYKREIKEAELRELELEELMRKLKIEKEKKNMLNTYFDEDKKNLVEQMILQELESVTNEILNEELIKNGVDETEITTRRMMLQDARKEYDNEKIIQESFERPLFVFVKYVADEDKLVIFDYVTDEEYEIHNGEEVMVMGQFYAKAGDELVVEGMHMPKKTLIEQTQKRKTAKLKEKFKTFVVEGNGYFVEDIIPITGEQLLMAGDFLNEPIKRLVEDAELDYKKVKNSRELVDTKLFFEIIEEHKNEARREMMRIKRQKAVNEKINEYSEMDDLLKDLEESY